MPHTSTNPPICLDGNGHVEQTRAAAREGLVYYQQSLERPDASSGASQDAARRCAALQAVQPRRPARRPGRYRVHLAGEAGDIVVDTHLARLRRCQKRVHSWAKAIPTQTRVIRRANRTINIGPRMVMLTLTYRNADEWQPNQIRDYLIALRGELGDRLYAYAWVLEMQKRGAPHYHVLVYVARGTDVPMPDKSFWHYGSSKRETAHTIYYICKYTGSKKQKTYQKEGFPLGARMFAVKVYQTDIPDDRFFHFRISSAPM